MAEESDGRLVAMKVLCDCTVSKVCDKLVEGRGEGDAIGQKRKVRFR